jgi:hypothetical protein
MIGAGADDVLRLVQGGEKLGFAAAHAGKRLAIQGAFAGAGGYAGYQATGTFEGGSSAPIWPAALAMSRLGSWSPALRATRQSARRMAQH